MSKFEDFYKEINADLEAYDHAPWSAESGASINKLLEDTAGKIMAAVVTKELTNSEAQNLLTYIHIVCTVKV